MVSAGEFINYVPYTDGIPLHLTHLLRTRFVHSLPHFKFLSAQWPHLLKALSLDELTLVSTE
jgi:hypothetical protein